MQLERKKGSWPGRSANRLEHLSSGNRLAAYAIVDAGVARASGFGTFEKRRFFRSCVPKCPNDGTRVALGGRPARPRSIFEAGPFLRPSASFRGVFDAGTMPCDCGEARYQAAAGLFVVASSGFEKTPMRARLFVTACLLAFASSALAQAHRNVDWPRVGNDPGCMRYSALQQINRRQRRTAQARLDLPHRRTQGPHRQDDRMHADRDRRRDVRHDRPPPRCRPGRGDRPRNLAVRSAEGPSVPARTDVRRRQPRLCLLVGRSVRRRATDRPRHCGRPAVFSRRENRPTRPEVRRCGHRRSPPGPSPVRRHRLGYGPTSAPAIWKDTIIVGVSCGEGPDLAAPGDIRAFDIRTRP